MNRNQRKVLEQLLSLENRTIGEVAQAAGVHRTTVYNYLKDDEFSQALTASESAAVKIATSRLIGLLDKAVDGLGSVLDFPVQAGATNKRLAAVNILELMLKIRTTYDLEERMAAIEKQIAEIR